MTAADPAPPRLLLGCMTGTSIDAIDVAVVEARGHGLSLRPRFRSAVACPLGPMAAPLRRLAEQEPMTAGAIAALSRDFSMLHAGACQAALAGRRADLVAVHGQTVFHAPPLSWQLLSPAVIAAALNAPVVSAMRDADLAAGGQGAPITPLADHFFFGHLPGCTAVVNLGGFCNITLLRGLAPDRPSDPAAIRGFDVCACNHLLDAVARRMLGAPFDDAGRAAASAEPDDDALDDLEGLLAAQSGSRRSLGTGDEVSSWLGRHRARVGGPALAATACEAIAQSIARAVLAHGDPPARILLAGGGVRNAALVKAITSAASARVGTVADHGVPIESREAAAMAVLGALCQDGVPITLPTVTGVRAAPLAGTFTPAPFPA